MLREPLKIQSLSKSWILFLAGNNTRADFFCHTVISALRATCENEKRYQNERKIVTIHIFQTLNV